MSVATEISRLQTAKSDIKTAIEAKGVTVPSSAKIDVYDDYISQIPTGKQKQYDDVSPGVYAYYADGTLKDYADADYAASGVAIISTSSKFVLLKRQCRSAMDRPLGAQITDSFLTSSGHYEYKRNTDRETLNADIFTCFNGYKNTYWLQKDFSSSDVLSAYTLFKEFGNTVHLGGAGQWKLILDNLDSVQQMLSKIEGDAISTTYPKIIATLGSLYLYDSYYVSCCNLNYGNTRITYGTPTSAEVRGIITLDYDYDNLQPIQ